MKKAISVIIALFLIIPFVPVSHAASGVTVTGFLLCDTDCDGIVTMRDVLALRKCIASIIPLDSINRGAADVNCDGAVNMRDTLGLRKRVLGIAPAVLTKECETVEASQTSSLICEYLETASGAPLTEDVVTSFVDISGTSLYFGGNFETGLPQGADVTLIDRSTGRGWIIENVGENYILPALIPGHTYYYFAVFGGEVIAENTVVASGPVRIIYVDNKSWNIRDIGGADCGNGKTIRYGVVFRGGRLDGGLLKQTDDALQYFRNFYGIKSDIDLRRDPKTAGPDSIIGNEDDEPVVSSPFGDDVEYERFPVTAYAAGLTNETSAALYVQILRRITNEVASGRPVYYHCEAGCDRAGTVSVLLDALCGVSESDIAARYELSSFKNTQEFYRPRSYNSPNGFQGLISYLWSLGEETLAENARQWALGAGMTNAEIDALIDLLTE